MQAGIGKASQTQDLATLIQGNQVIVLDKCRDTTTAEGFSIPKTDTCLKNQQWGGSLPKPAKISEVVGNSRKGVEKDSINGVSLHLSKTIT